MHYNQTRFHLHTSLFSRYKRRFCMILIFLPLSAPSQNSPLKEDLPFPADGACVESFASASDPLEEPEEQVEDPEEEPDSYDFQNPPATKPKQRRKYSIREALQAAQMERVVSLDAPTSPENDSPIIDLIPDPSSPDPEKQAFRESLQKRVGGILEDLGLSHADYVFALWPFYGVS